jgi:hypothetical protein
MSKSVANKRKSSATSDQEVSSTRGMLKQAQESVHRDFNIAKTSISQKREAVISKCGAIYKTSKDDIATEGTKLGNIEEIVSKIAMQSNRRDRIEEQLNRFSKEISSFEKFDSKGAINNVLADMTAEVGIRSITALQDIKTRVS